MWLLMVTTLPTENTAVRQRVWRALKASGAAVLRDGVYLMPDSSSCRAALNDIAAEVLSGSGTAWILRTEDPERGDFKALFDRGSEYAALLADISALMSALPALPGTTLAVCQKRLKKLHKTWAALAAIDFFPGAAREQAQTALQDMDVALLRLTSPDEPRSVSGDLPQFAGKDFIGRQWATRQRPWIDRLASAWLITRFIDSNARFLWLRQPADCPQDALGFDFDGAAFTHVGGRVTFEVLVACFGLEREHPVLLRLGALVHYLDVGGIQPPEAAGVASILSGLRARIVDDDQLMNASSAIFDDLYAAFRQQADGA